MQALNKTKAALQGRQCDFASLQSGSQDTTAISLVNLDTGIPVSVDTYHPGNALNKATKRGSVLRVTKSHAQKVMAAICWLSVCELHIYNTAEVQTPKLAFAQGSDALQKILIWRLVCCAYDASLSEPRAILRWRYEISRFKAATINCPVLSPGSFTFSISSIISCGARDCSFCDLSFFVPVAMTEFLLTKWITVYMEEFLKKALKWIPLYNYSGVHLKCFEVKTAKPGSAGTLTGPLTKPLIGVTVMAELQSIQTHPKVTEDTKFFSWRFLALSAADRSVIHITAATEREAREQSPSGCVMVFAGRLPAGVRHV